MVTGEALVELTAVSALLLIAGAVVFGLVVLAAIAERPRRVPRPDPVKLRAAAQELASFAGQTHAVAGRAAAAAIEARERLAAAEEARESAWQAQEAAGTAYRVAWQEAQYARPERDPPTVDMELVAAGDVDGPDGDRQREVSRAALSAYRRGELSVDELRDVWRRAGDWDPEREERDRRTAHLRAEELAARRAYERAALVARQATEALWAAEATSRALSGEAMAAAAEAHDALLVSQRYTGRSKGGRKGREKKRRKG
jgi:hypothetical protein